MAKKARKEAYVVKNSKMPSLYCSEKECNAQVHRYSGQDYQGYHSKEQAGKAWGKYLSEGQLQSGEPRQFGEPASGNRGSTLEKKNAENMDENITSSKWNAFFVDLGGSEANIAPGKQRK